MATTALKIVSAYRGQANYVRTARSRPSFEWEGLWQEYAVEPFWAEWAGGQFNEARTREQFSRPILNLDGLAEAAERLSQSQVEALVDKAYGEITERLPSSFSGRAVCIYAGDPDNQWLREQGVVGTGIGDNILLQINPLAEGWQLWAPYVMAHEYHHAIWGYNYFAVRHNTSIDLQTGLMIDGEADTFAKLLYPERQPAWINALAPGEEAEQWKEMQPYLDGNDRGIYERFFFGDKATETPAHTAYTIGYHIVQAYLKRHPAQSVFDLMDLDARAILAESEYQT